MDLRGRRDVLAGKKQLQRFNYKQLQTVNFNFNPLLIALATLVASDAFAQSPEAAKEAEDRLRIDFFIDAELSGAYRSHAITRILDRDNNTDSEAFLAPRLTIRAEARLPKSAEVVVEIENARLRSNLFDSDTWGTDANRVIPGRADDFEALVEQAYIRVDNLFWNQLSVKIGLQDFALALRGPGDSFFADLQESEFALVSPVAESVTTGSLYGMRAPDGTTPATAGVFRDRADAGGARLTWNVAQKSLLFVDAFWFTTLEGGVRHADERFYGLNADFLIPITEDRPSLVNVMFSGIDNDRAGSQIWTGGLGLDFSPMAPVGLDIYLELYGQWGHYADTPAHGVHQRAFAGRAGVKLPLPLPLKPAIEGSVWLLSGDRGDPDDSTNRDFVSYENINEALVVEDALYGLDIDSNYFSPRLRATATAKLFNPDDLHIELLYAWFRFHREPARAGGPGRSDPARKIGHEIDLRARFEFSEHASFSIFAGALLDSPWLAARDAFYTRTRRAFIGGVQLNVGF
ncbi:MAG: hypothetical protein FD180_31 [Planctomycetota bacterium]|nr:MAG: hypothetical protein FD180_31 [Planctomycetota bacterium]